MIKPNPASLGPIFATIAITLFTLNDAAMKVLSGGYALHQIVLIRSLVGLVIVLAIMAPLSGGWHLLKTRRLGAHLARALCVVFANMMFFLGIAAMPLADAVALFFISPFLITIFSVIFLGESVGPRRWVAVLIGMLGVLIVLRPGSQAFQMASLLPLAAAFGYAGLHIMTRYMRGSENAVSMTFYIQITFIVIGVVLGLAIGDGRFAQFSDPSLDFLLRAWSWPENADLPILMILGVFASVGGYFISQAYRLGEAALVAPFEYIALPLSIFWGVMFFGEWPDTAALLGISLIAASGLYTVWRENRASAPLRK
jgi:drug/metabolite transporter (DMT)-like permease